MAGPGVHLPYETMRTPVRSEADAFWLTIGAATLLAVSVVIGWLSEPLAGVVVFAVVGVAALVAYAYFALSDRPASLREALGRPRPRGSARRVLVVANEVLAGSELGEVVQRHNERVEVDVLAPVLASRAHFGTSDIDREVADARVRLERSLSWVREQGIVARGEVGDPNPITALQDQLRDFGADEVIVVTHPRDRETWQERGELARLQGELDIPVTHLVVAEDGCRHGSCEARGPAKG